MTPEADLVEQGKRRRRLCPRCLSILGKTLLRPCICRHKSSVKCCLNDVGRPLVNQLRENVPFYIKRHFAAHALMRCALTGGAPSRVHVRISLSTRCLIGTYVLGQALSSMAMEPKPWRGFFFLQEIYGGAERAGHKCGNIDDAVRGTQSYAVRAGLCSLGI